MKCTPLAPSIFAETPHESRSDRYAYIPTIQIVEGMMKEGFLPFSVMQARSRSESRREYTKHLIRFRHAEMLKGTPHVGQLFPEIVLINSHDGSTAYQLMSGIFRLVCTNGMITGTQYGDYKIRHQGDITGQVIDASYKVLNTAEQVMDAARRMERHSFERTGASGTGKSGTPSSLCRCKGECVYPHPPGAASPAS